MRILNTLPPAVLYQGTATVASQTVTVGVGTHGISNLQPGDKVSAAVKDDDTGSTLGNVVSANVSGTDIVVVLQNAPTNNDGVISITVSR